MQRFPSEKHRAFRLGNKLDRVITNRSNFCFRVFLKLRYSSNHETNQKKEKIMKKLQLLAAVIVFSALTGCLSIRSGGAPGPQGPQGESGAGDKVIVVPEKQY